MFLSSNFLTYFYLNAFIISQISSNFLSHRVHKLAPAARSTTDPDDYTPQAPDEYFTPATRRGEIWIQMSLCLSKPHRAPAIPPCASPQRISPEVTCHLRSIYSPMKYFKIARFCTPLTIVSVTGCSYTWTAEAAEYRAVYIQGLLLYRLQVIDVF